MIVSVDQDRQIVDALERRDMDYAIEMLRENCRITLECTEQWLTM